MFMSAKVRAYIRASEVIAKTRAEAGLYDRKTAAAINRELALISERLMSGAKRAFRSDGVAKALADNPELAKTYRISQAARRYLNATKKMEASEKEVKALQEAGLL